MLTKKSLSTILILLSLLKLNAQQENSLTLRVEPGIIIFSDSENISLLINAEPKIKISGNGVIGLRFGLAVNSQKFNTTNQQYFIDDEYDNAILSFVPTYDYYFNENKYRPYAGLGIGYYLLNYIDINRIGSSKILEGNVKDKAGLLLRCGIEFGNTRYGLEYNFIPKADIEIPNGEIVGTVNNSYLGLSVGFTIGRGKV